MYALPRRSHRGPIIALLIAFALALPVCRRNRPPDPPGIPVGPATGLKDSLYTFNAVASDPNGDELAYRFSWDDGDSSDWSDWLPSGTPAARAHAWREPGLYKIRAQARDLHDAGSDWSDPHLIFISISRPPGAPAPPTGPAEGEAFIYHAFSSSAVDPDGDSVAIRFDWGDGNSSRWSPFVASGETATLTHAWSDTGTFLVTAQARDVHGRLSAPSDPVPIMVSGIWEPGPEDTAAILGWVEANAFLFSAGFFDRSMEPCDTLMPGRTKERLRDEVRHNPYRQRIRHNALQRVFDERGYRFRVSLMASAWADETTAVVTVIETIPGELRLQAFSYTRYLRDDTIFPSPGETLVLPVYDQQFSPIDRVVVKEFAGMKVDAVVMKKHAGVWQPRAYSGGSLFHAPDPADAPYILRMDLVAKRVGRPDTTVPIWYRPDSLQHGIDQFYAEEELPTFRQGDTLTISQAGVWVSPAGPNADMGAYIYFPDATLRYRRYEFQAPPRRDTTATRVPLDVAPGIYTLYATQTPIEVFYEIHGDRLELNPRLSGLYVGTVWGIRIRVVAPGRFPSF